MNDERNAMAAFERDVFGSAVRLGVLVVRWTIIRSKDDEGVVRDARFFQRGHHLADAPVEFLHHVAADAVLRSPFEVFAGLIRCMRIVVGVVQEERLAAFRLLANDRCDALGVKFRQFCRVGGPFNDFAVTKLLL